MASATGWSVDYILNGVNYQALIMMLSDAPRYTRRRQKETGKPDPNASEKEQAEEIAGFFRSNLKQ